MNDHKLFMSIHRKSGVAEFRKIIILTPTARQLGVLVQMYYLAGPIQQPGHSHGIGIQSYVHPTFPAEPDTMKTAVRDRSTMSNITHQTGITNDHQGTGLLT